jgi:hypothetical protein
VAPERDGNLCKGNTVRLGGQSGKDRKPSPAFTAQSYATETLDFLYSLLVPQPLGDLI